MPQADCIIIGAGVIGLAIAKKLSQHREVFVLEQHKQFGVETSSRNSEVIHAGIYYPQDFLKTSLCIEGRKQLYSYCEANHIAHKQCGKWIVANTNSAEKQLDEIMSHAKAAGVHDLQRHGQSDIQRHLPFIQARKAIFSPSTGIIDSHQYMLQLVADIESQGSQVLYQQKVTAAKPLKQGFELIINNSDSINCQHLVIAGGLHTQELARQLVNPDIIPPTYYCKGQYYDYSGKHPFETLVYPTPDIQNKGLGIHATLDLSGRLRFGPDVQYCNTPDYSLDASSKDIFVDAIKKYYPDLDEARLAPGYCGIRPKLSAEGEAMQDFMIHGPGDHQCNNLVMLYGIESPGLTSSLAIGDYVTQQVMYS